jgi:uncharacterized caspase-like protein
MHAIRALLWALLATVPLLPAEALADKRVALVIGNSNYVNVRRLPNPENDATAVAALFRNAGFDVVEAHNNMGGNAMRRAFRNFSDTARNSDIAVVYYAGHGIEVDGANYLLPTDVVLERDIDVDDEAISIERIVRILEPAKRLRLVILDACRDNPFVSKMKRVSATRSIGRGLARVEPQSSDTLIAFAAKAGSTADDGDGTHSPFTTALLKHITMPGLDLRIAFGRIRDDVLKLTGNRQEPFVYGSLGGTTVSLVPPSPEKPAVVATPAAPAPPDAGALARSDYDLAAKVGTVAAWEAFLAAHPTGFYADLAKAQRDRTNAPRTAAVQPPAATEVRKPTVDPAETTQLVHKELSRLGCYSGDINDRWGRPSRRAMEQFNRHSGLKLEVGAASTDTLAALRDKTERVCPVECRTGFVATSDGRCERKPADTAKKPDTKKPADTAQSRRDRREATTAQRPKTAPSAGGGGAKVICGMNGCINVRPGCRGEVRPSGRGDFAVEICGQ